MENYVVVLGSGESINTLTPFQRKLINDCEVKIGINKYSAFYEKAQIVPTHIYFLDDYENKTIRFFMYILEKLKTDKLKGLNIIVSKKYKKCLSKNFFSHYLFYVSNFITKIICDFLIFLGYVLISRINYKVYGKYKKEVKKHLPYKNKLRYKIIDKSWKLEYLMINSWNDPSTSWANSLEEIMFHYRGSLTTVLNYISIKFPNKKILFVGVDLNTSTYFFENELKEFYFETHDWTTSISKKENKHFSIIDYEGTKMDDILLKVIDSLKQSGNEVFSLNKESYLVINGFVKTIEI